MPTTIDARDADPLRQSTAPAHDRHRPLVMTADGDQRAERSEE
jgi:hypothetical protein